MRIFEPICIYKKYFEFTTYNWTKCHVLISLILQGKHGRTIKTVGVAFLLSAIILIGIVGTIGKSQNPPVARADALPCGEAVGCPTGLATYGYNYQNGTSYSVESDGSAGFISFDSMQANNSYTVQWDSGDPVMANASTLQLNNVLVVNNTNGSQDVYWPQNVLAFGNVSSKSSAVVYTDNVLNITSHNAEFAAPDITSPNGTIVGNSSTGYYYGDYLKAPHFTVETPFSEQQIMEEFVNPSHGVTLYMGVEVLQNGTATPDKYYWYDTITIHDTHVSSAYFYVTLSYAPPGYPMYYDSEFVFGGPFNGRSTTFSSMNSTIGLFYLNSTDYEDPFQSYYSYGSDTGETASNLLVNYLGGGMADVTLGSPYYGPLTQAATSTSSSNLTSSSSSTLTNSSSSDSSTAQTSTSSSKVASSSSTASLSHSSTGFQTSRSSTTALSPTVSSSTSASASNSLTITPALYSSSTSSHLLNHVQNTSTTTSSIVVSQQTFTSASGPSKTAASSNFNISGEMLLIGCISAASASVIGILVLRKRSG